MPDNYTKNFNLIAGNESRFARRVIYQMRAQHPPPVWHNLIPFKFLIEYIRIRRAIRTFENNAMVIRKLSLDAARSILDGESHERVHFDMNEKIKTWLQENELFLQIIHGAQIALAQQFEAHYARLLQADGKNYATLVKSVYPIPPRYREFLEGIAETEKQVDDSVCETISNDDKERQECETRMKNKQRAFSKAREIELQQVYA